MDLPVRPKIKEKLRIGALLANAFLAITILFSSAENFSILMLKKKAHGYIQ